VALWSIASAADQPAWTTTFEDPARVQQGSRQGFLEFNNSQVSAYERQEKVQHARVEAFNVNVETTGLGTAIDNLIKFELERAGKKQVEVASRARIMQPLKLATGFPGFEFTKNYKCIWTDDGSGADLDGSVWRPNLPPNAVFFGDVIKTKTPQVHVLFVCNV